LTFEPPDQMLAHPDNWRRHPPAQREVLRSVMDKIGWVGCVLQNDRTGHLLDGHERVEEVLSSGQPTVPVLHVDIDEVAERVVLTTFDTIALMASRDEAKLDTLLSDIGQRTSGVLNSLIQTMAQTHRWPQLKTDDDNATGSSGNGTAVHARSPLSASPARARWTLMFRRDATDTVRETLEDLRDALGPQVELTWLEG
jgi:hypothetical protein